jgi:hypothetical protein
MLRKGKSCFFRNVVEKGVIFQSRIAVSKYTNDFLSVRTLSNQQLTIRTQTVLGDIIINQNQQLFKPVFMKMQNRYYCKRNVLPTLSQRQILQEVWPKEDLSSHNLARLLEKEV